jgi:hypothetical protein
MVESIESAVNPGLELRLVENRDVGAEAETISRAEGNADARRQGGIPEKNTLE